MLLMEEPLDHLGLLLATPQVAADLAHHLPGILGRCLRIACLVS
jgi:hypothetical protein